MYNSTGKGGSFKRDFTYSSLALYEDEINKAGALTARVLQTMTTTYISLSDLA